MRLMVVIDEAHKHGYRTAAHIVMLDDAKGVLRAGVDYIAHSVRDREVDAEFIRLMKKRHVSYSPTLTRELAVFMYTEKPSFFSDPFFLKEADPGEMAQMEDPKRENTMRTDPADFRRLTLLIQRMLDADALCDAEGGALLTEAEAAGRSSREALAAAGIDPVRRPETLTQEDLLRLASTFAHEP